MTVIPYEAEHMWILSEQPATAWLGEYLGAEHARELEKHPGYTLLDSEGRIVGCVGAIKMWENRCEVWAVLEAGLKHDFMPLHNKAKHLMDMLPYKRVEAKVDYGYMNAHRWVKTLGFEIETPHLVNYFPDGRDATGYVKFNG